MLIIYADGACSGNPGPAGSAIVLVRDTTGKLEACGSSERSIGHATNQIAELVAALMAIESAMVQPESEITIRCDSEYVVKGVSEWLAGWLRNGWRTSSKKPVANRDHWIAINDAMNRARGELGKVIRFEWVRGHSVDRFNNMVDELAVAASKMQPGTVRKPVAAAEPAPASLRDQITAAVRGLCDGTVHDDPSQWSLTCNAEDVIALVERFASNARA